MAPGPWRESCGPGSQGCLFLGAAAVATWQSLVSTNRGVEGRLSSSPCSFVFGESTHVLRGMESETGTSGSRCTGLEQRSTSQATATGLGAAGVASGLVAVSSHVRRRRTRQCRQQLVLHAGDDFVGSIQRTAQQQVESAVEGPNKVLATAQDIADAALAVPGNTAKAVEESSTWLRNGLGNLQSAPQELGGKLASPVVTTATIVADSTKAVVDGTPSKIENLAAIPTAVKSRFFDAPVAAIQSAQDTASKILGVPGKLINRTQDSLSAAEKVLSAVVALPGRLKDRVDGTVGGVQRASSAVAALPGRFSDDINKRVSGVQNGVSRVQNAATGFAQSAEAVISFPGKTAAEIASFATGVSNTIDGIAELPSRAQEAASKVRNVVAIPGTLLKPAADAVGTMKSQIDGDTGADKSQPEKGSEK